MSKFNKKLSIIIPVYNEKHTIQKILNKIYKLKNINKEIIVVNDFYKRERIQPNDYTIRESFKAFQKFRRRVYSKI